MSDNVVLSKHFDSLASAIQRCLSAGYAPTAYIPTGKASVLDTVPATVDGGLWYELESGIPVVKMYYNKFSLEVVPPSELEKYLVLYLRYSATEECYIESCGHTYTKVVNGSGERVWFWVNDNSVTSVAKLPKIAGIYFKANASMYFDCALNYYDNFSICSWVASSLSSSGVNSMFQLYTSDDENATVLSFDYKADPSDSDRQIFYLTLGNDTYEFPSVYYFNSNRAIRAHHLAFCYKQESNLMYLFYDGENVGSVVINLRAQSLKFTKIAVGSFAANTVTIADFKVYNGIQRYLSNFTPTFMPEIEQN